MKPDFIAAIWVVFALLLGACRGTASDPAPTPVVKASPNANPTPTPEARTIPEAKKPAWQVRWEETVKKAKAEGRVVITGGSAAIEYRPIYSIFEKKFGIKVESSGGLSRQVVDRILAERRAGRAPEIDLMFSGGTTLGQRMMPNNALAPIREYLMLPEVVDGSNWYQGHLWFGLEDPKERYILAYSATVDSTVVSSWYNATRLTPEELQSIQSVWDLVDPKWAGKVVGTSPDSTDSGWDTLWFHPQIGERWYHRLFSAGFRVTFMADPRVISDQLALGKFAMCFPCANVGRPLRDLQALGASVYEFGGQKHHGFREQQFLATTGARSNLGVVADGPNPNATKVFLNWFLSKEGQTAIHLFAQGPRPTLRVDVTDMGLTNPGDRRQPGRDYVELARIVPDYNVAHAKAMEQILQMYYQSVRR